MRRLVALIDGLPHPSALSRAVLGNEWTDDTALLACIADRLGVVATAGKYGLRAVPDPVPRPDTMKPAAETVSDPAAIAAFFGGGS